MDEKLRGINLNNVPRHIAIIMDGNGRWAKKQGMQRVFGHRNALTAVRQAVEASADIGTKFITLYAFSTENWNRPKLEVDALMSLLINSLRKELPDFHKNGIKVNSIGATENYLKKHKEYFKKLFMKLETTAL